MCTNNKQKEQIKLNKLTKQQHQLQKIERNASIRIRRKCLFIQNIQRRVEEFNNLGAIAH